MDVFTYAKSAQYVEIWDKDVSKRRECPELRPKVRDLDMMLGGNNTAVLEKLAQFGEQWQGLTTMLVLYLGCSEKWARPSGLTRVVTSTFGFGYRGCMWRCDRDDNIAHSTRTACVLLLQYVRQRL